MSEVFGKTAYDEVPYHSFLRPELYLDRIATAARLFGLEDTPVNQRRVLKLTIG